MRFTNPLFLLALIPLFVGLYWSFFQVQGMARKRKTAALDLDFLGEVLAGAAKLDQV